MPSLLDFYSGIWMGMLRGHGLGLGIEKLDSNRMAVE